MELDSISQDDWFSLANDGATVITVNRRLARYLHQQFDEYQLSKDKRRWNTPFIVPLSGWYTSYWNDYSGNDELIPATADLLLSSFQSQCLWKQIIASNRGSFLAKADDELSKLAQKAWTLVNEWHINIAQLKGSGNANVEAFSHWLACYLESCSKSEWIDEAMLPTKVIDLLEKRDEIEVQGTYIFAGFDEFSPRQKRLFVCLTQLGCQVRVMEFPDNKNNPKKRCFKNIESELSAIAIWARGITEKHPDASIGVVLPELANQRSLVISQFTQVLNPASLLDFADSSKLFNVSLGCPLAEYPLIRSIFSAFQLIRPVVEVEAVSSFLLNAYFCGEKADADSRAMLDYSIRSLGEAQTSLSRVLEIIKKNASLCSLDWVSEQLGVLADFQKTASESLYPSQWCSRFATLLQQLGWLRSFALTSDEYQLYRAWGRVLDEFSKLDSVAGVVDIEFALLLLQKMTSEMVFQPEAEVVPIHILGLFETAGISFDYLWIAGLQDDVLPASPSPNPLLPLTLQKELGLPQSSYEKELAYGQILFRRLIGAAPNIVLSCSLSDGEMALRPSSLFDDDGDSATNEEMPKIESVAAQIYAASEMVAWQDYTSAFKHSQIKGGVGIFKQFAQCPFKAFVSYRLGVKPLQPTSSGLNPLERGILLHAILEKFWSQVKSSNALCELSEPALDKLLTEVIKKEVIAMARYKPFTFTPRFFSMECKRLKERVKAWLVVEKERPDFEVIAVEKKHDVNIAGLTLSTTVDRIDRLNDGSILLIDYKTGTPMVKAWFGQRPDEPQLPLYAVTSQFEVRGVAFAQIRPGEMVFKGLTDSQETPKGIEAFSKSKYATYDETWDGLKDEWQRRLTHLANEFVSGVANVDPKEGAKTCQACDYSSFCRVSELETEG